MRHSLTTVDAWDLMKVRQRKLIQDVPETPERIALREASVCAYCRKQVPVLHRDHIEPLSRGGAHSVSNTAWVCPPCNGAKKNRFPLEWAMAGLRHFDARRDFPKPPKRKRGYYYPMVRVKAIRGDVEILECGHHRAPRYTRLTASGSDTGLSEKRVCFKCGVDMASQWPMHRATLATVTR